LPKKFLASILSEGGFSVFDTLREDIASIKDRDPAARSGFEVLFLYSGLHALIYYRIAHRLFLHNRFMLARWLSQHAKFTTGIEIHPGAKIGKGLFIDHGTGVVIGETAEIGDYCALYQGVTLGGTGKDKGKRHPTLGSNVMVGAGAKILGPFKVGDNAKVGANALVLSEVPPNATAVGVPAHVVRVNGERVNIAGRRSDLDQIHMPDPVAQEICRLQMKIDGLQNQIDALLTKGGE
jgi:serine O-acetyltransferase